MTVVVVGAGPAGLAVAATLREHHVACQVLERSTDVGAAWRSRYDSLRLHTVRWLSGLPGFRIPRRYGAWVARDDVVAYLQEYVDRMDVQVEFGVTVRRVERAETGWHLDTSAGGREAAAVVIATGYSREPVIPDWPGRAEFRPGLIHSADYREPSAYAGKRVLVVGAGNSATEIACDLVDAGAGVDVAVRTPPNIVRRDTLGVPSQLFGIFLRRLPEGLMNPVSGALRRLSVPDLTAFGLPAPPGDSYTQFLRTRTTPILDHGFVRLVSERRISIVAAVDHLSGDEVHLADGSTLRPDAVICATGYRPGLDEMVGHLGVLDDDGIPVVHGAETAPQAPGLYFIGVTVQLAGLLREIGLEARQVGRSLAGPRRSWAR